MKIGVMCGVLMLAGTFAQADVFEEMLEPEIPKELWIEQPLTDEYGSGWRGVNLYMDEVTANCVGCHENPDLAATGLSGDVGPKVRMLGSDFERAELRAILVNAPIVFGEDTAMPAFYEGADPLLSAQQVEDLIAYLMELRRR